MNINSLWYLKVIVIGITLSLTVAGGAVASDLNEVALLSLGILTFVATAAPIFMERNYRVWSPLTFVLPFVLFGVTFKIVYILAMDTRSSYVQSMLLMNQTPTVLLYGTGVVCTGMLFFVIGYCLAPRPSHSTVWLQRLTDRVWDPKRLLIFALLIVPISTVFFALLVNEVGADLSNIEEFSRKRFAKADSGASERLHTREYYFYRGAYISKFLLYAMLTWVVANRRSFFSGWGILIAITGLQSLIVPLFIDNRAGVVLIVVDAIVIACLLKKQITYNQVLIPAVFAVVLIALMLGNRSQSGGGAINIVEQTLVGRDFMDVAKTAHIINAVPNTVPYLYGESLYGWLVAPIPRSMWRDKPMWIEMPVLIMQTVFAGQDAKGANSIPPGLIAELYMNFGWVGVCVGMFFAGMALRFIFLIFDPLQSNAFAMLIYTIIVSRLAMGMLGNDLGTGIIKAALDVIPTILLVLCVSHQVQRKEQTVFPVGRIAATA